MKSIYFTFHKNLGQMKFEEDSVSESDFSEEEIGSTKETGKLQDEPKKRKYGDLVSEDISENGNSHKRKKEK
ncbi:hypothetical protein NQ314_019043 [Rhamnusium bicolor]|uniref:Uncharacterized protein n=1 Tax=Rhamnusium bicolor TaxID=1586634 RepID=A0AAV8WPJ0_9CUCU|nr:hypothetical protein NQ314_019043 [Rhamnusium bicolor]